MLRILNILENSENFEKLETDDEIIKQQPAKNTINSHIICFNSSIYSTTKKNNQEMLKKKLNKTFNEANNNKVHLLFFANKRKNTNKKCSNNKDNFKN